MASFKVSLELRISKLALLTMAIKNIHTIFYGINKTARCIAKSIQNERGSSILCLIFEWIAFLLEKAIIVGACVLD